MGILAARSKMCSIIMAGLSFETLVVFIILKLDGFTVLNHLDWIKLVVIPFVIAMTCVIIYMLIHFFSDGAENVDKAHILHPPQVLQEQDPSLIENYNELHVFRDILLFCLYLLFIVYGLLIYFTPCASCNTPYPMLSLGVVVTYALRVLVLIYHFRVYYVRYNLMAFEIANYQTLSDDNRFFNQALPDLHVSDDWSISYILDIAMFLFTILLALLGTVWVANNECAVRCVKLFHYSKYLLAGMYVFEAFYLVSCLMLRFYVRTSGVETMQTLFHRLKTQNISNALKATVNLKGNF